MMFRMATDSFSVLLKLCKLLYPSSSSRRRTRSSTSDWEMPKSSKVCGTVGLNPLWAGAIVAAMKDRKPHSLHRPNPLYCLHTMGTGAVNPLVKLCACIVLLLITAGGLGGSSPGETPFLQG